MTCIRPGGCLEPEACGEGQCLSPPVEARKTLAKLDDLIRHRDELAEEVARLRKIVRDVHAAATDPDLGTIETIEHIINLTEEVE